MSCIEPRSGATVMNLTPDQKVACSDHVGVSNVMFQLNLLKSLRRIIRMHLLITDTQTNTLDW